jgi:hypothetical protein
VVKLVVKPPRHNSSGETKIPQSLAGYGFDLVEDIGVEPMTSCMPCKRSTN